MSNFIDRLISQHLELSPLIQPRQPSRFEPPSVTDSNGLGNSLWREQPDLEPHTSEVGVQPSLAGTMASIQPTRSSHSPSTTVGALNVSVSPLTNSPPNSPHWVNMSKPDPMMDLAPSPYQSPIVEELKVDPHHIPMISSNKAQVADIETKLPAIESVSTTPQSAKLSPAQWVQVNPPIDQSPVSNVKPVRSSEKTLVTSNSSAIYQEGYLSSPRRSLEQTDHPSAIRPTSAEPYHSTIKVEPSPSTIQVSIGRIEIKATPTPTQPRKTPTKPPTMSLDEYLHRRNGGGNR